MCVSSFLSSYVTYIYNLINYFFSGASLGHAPARRLFLPGNFLIENQEMTANFLKMCIRCTIGFWSGMWFQINSRLSFDGFRCYRFAFAWIHPSSFHSSVVQISSQSVAE